MGWGEASSGLGQQGAARGQEWGQGRGRDEWAWNRVRRGQHGDRE